MHIEPEPKAFWLRVGLLLFATPFLLFPTFSLIGTLLALTAVLLTLLPRPQTLTAFHPPLILFSLMVIVGILVTADLDLTLPKATGLILGLSSCYLLATAVHTPRQLHWSLVAWLLIVLGFTVLGAITTKWVFKIPLLESTVTRLPSTLLVLPDSSDGVQANQLAGTILLYWPFLISLLIGWRKRGWKTAVPLTTSTLVITILLILTQSRSGWLGGLGGLVCLLSWWSWLTLSAKRRWWLWLSLGVFAIALIGAVMWIGPERLQELWVDPVQETAIGRLNSVGFRQEVWRWSVEAIKSFPFTGTGLGTFRRVGPRLFPLNVPPTYDISHAHNIFLQVALDIGLPGLIAYITLLLLAGKVGWQVAGQDAALRPLAIGLVTSIVSLHIYGLTDALALGSKTGLLFWLALGILAAMKNVKRKT